MPIPMTLFLPEIRLSDYSAIAQNNNIYRKKYVKLDQTLEVKQSREKTGYYRFLSIFAKSILIDIFGVTD